MLKELFYARLGTTFFLKEKRKKLLKVISNLLTKDES